MRKHIIVKTPKDVFGVLYRTGLLKNTDNIEQVEERFQKLLPQSIFCLRVQCLFTCIAFIGAVINSLYLFFYSLFRLSKK